MPEPAYDDVRWTAAGLAEAQTYFTKLCRAPCDDWPVTAHHQYLLVNRVDAPELYDRRFRLLCWLLDEQKHTNHNANVALCHAARWTAVNAFLETHRHWLIKRELIRVKDDDTLLVATRLLEALAVLPYHRLGMFLRATVAEHLGVSNTES